MTAVAACMHRWVLSAPAGDITPGYCKVCGVTRDFPSEPARIAPTTTARPSVFNTALVPASKPEYVYTVHEKAPKPARETKARQPRESAKRKAVLTCVECGVPVSENTNERCLVCYRAYKARTLTPEQEAILAYLAEHKDAHAREIAEALGLETRSIAQRMKLLGFRGLVEKRPSQVNPTWSTYHLAPQQVMS